MAPTASACARKAPGRASAATRLGRDQRPVGLSEGRRKCSSCFRLSGEFCILNFELHGRTFTTSPPPRDDVVARLAHERRAHRTPHAGPARDRAVAWASGARRGSPRSWRVARRFTCGHLLGVATDSDGRPLAPKLTCRLTPRSWAPPRRASGARLRRCWRHPPNAPAEKVTSWHARSAES